MTDYGYTQHVQLTGEESKNDADSLSGHSLDVTPDQHWPGTSADPGKTRHDPDKMGAIIEQLQQFVEAMQNSGAAEIRGKTSSVSYGPPDWQAATYLKSATDQVGQLVSQYAQQLSKNLTDAASSIQSALAHYGGAENANTGSAKNQQSSVGM